MDSTSPVVVSSTFLGPCLIGIFLNVALYGITVAQTQTYFTVFRKDPKWLKAYIAVLFMADSMNAVFNATWIYRILIHNYGNPNASAGLNWLFQSEQSLAGIVATMVQLFYARRILILTKNKWITVFVVLASLSAGFCAVGTAIAISFDTGVLGLSTKIVKGFAIPWLVSCACCDTTIAVTLTMYLTKRKTGFTYTDNAVNKLIGLIVSNGLLTASFTILHLTTFLSLTSGLHMIFNYGNVKLYTNAVLASLNSRRDPTVVHHDEDKLNDRGLNFAHKSSIRRGPVEVTVTEERHETVDIGPLPKSDWPETADTTESFDRTKDVGSV